MKPPCIICGKEGKEKLSSIFGQRFIEDLAYELFNPSTEEKSESSTLRELVERYLFDDLDEAVYDMLVEMLGEDRTDLLSESNLRNRARSEIARKKAWEDLISKIKSGEIQPEHIQPSQLLQHFPEEVLEGLIEEGLIEEDVRRSLRYTRSALTFTNFTVKGERIIAQRLLQEVFKNLEKSGFGIHVTEEEGYGIEPTNLLREFDEYTHTYDLIDWQETLLTTALRDAKEMRILPSDIKVRVPRHRARCANVILLDISNSMYGIKFKGGLMAALALERLFQEEYKEDVLHILAYNEEVYLVPPGQLLKLRPYGFTDIGYAIESAVKILEKEEGEKNIFLITDSEPTASNKSELSPLENAFRASYLAGRAEIRLNIIMLDKKPILRTICDRIAALNGQAAVAYVDNPLNLKEFVIKTVIDRKRKRYS
jgi:Ca-activated chloride channel family protein